LRDGALAYAYDAAHRMTTITMSGLTTVYAYNGLGNRLTQTVNLRRGSGQADALGRVPDNV
jgi:hypothetical protein